MNIKRINTCTTQKICSSQAVVSMAAAIKELVENSLDAHCTKIEIRFKNLGADIIEVHDDGVGISSDEFYEFTARNTTTKIENFEDLNKLETFGFRGEALNSLCFLGDVQIHTNSLTTAIGSFLKFDRSGKVINVSPLARQKGTTVYIKNLFHTLPVRRKQFLINLKREFDRAIKYVMGYCLISEGVQISCYKIDKNKKLILSTKGIGGIGGNIESVFGHNQLKLMIKLVTEHNINQDILDEFHINKLADLNKIQLSGWISCPTDVMNSNNTDKQFLYINNRPCELPKIKKIISECYRVMNKAQTPAFVITISLPKETVDVNIEPDKRSLLMDNQPEVLAVIKASILSCFSASGFSKEFRNLDRSLSESIHTFLNNTTSDDQLININKSQNTLKHPLNSPDTTPSKYPRLEPNNSDNISFNNREIKLPLVVSKAEKVHFSMKSLSNIDSNFNTDITGCSDGGYQSKISTSDNEKAEEELKTIFRKKYFNELEVIGQFNKGFIIARKNLDLFIIDQHASDEKKQFEKLLDECKVSSQPLVCSQRLHITPGDEEIIIEHLELFQRWGFKFQFNDGEFHHRVFLTSVPCRNNLVLGFEDIQEMIQILKDVGSPSMIMPSRVRTAIASNACRSAIMIGTSLSHSEMGKILKNMSALKDPWSCAHGRPTMRHLHCLSV